VGLPLLSGPVVAFVALEQGTSFAAATSAGILAGILSTAAFAVIYAWLALRWSWPVALAGASGAFVAATAALEGLLLPAVALFGLAALGLAVALVVLPRAGGGAANSVARRPSWDLPARMALATVFVLALTGAAPLLGPRLTGLIAPYPVMSTVLGVFAHAQQGPWPAVGVLRGLLLGLFSFAAFFLVLATLLVPLGLLPAMLAALAVALLSHGGSLLLLRRH
jgi:hypothetical protein